MNERPKLGGGHEALNVCLWVVIVKRLTVAGPEEAPPCELPSWAKSASGSNLIDPPRSQPLFHIPGRSCRLRFTLRWVVLGTEFLGRAQSG